LFYKNHRHHVIHPSSETGLTRTCYYIHTYKGDPE
jgi:hypothetical protein